MEKTSETINAITKFLFLGKEEHELDKYDLVIFLGNNDIEGSSKALKHLWDTGHITNDSKVILSGNVGVLDQGEEPEAKRIFESTVALGLPKSIFIIEDKATNTLENLKFSKTKAEEIQSLTTYRNILFIGKAFMARRAIMCASACGYPVDKIDFFGTVDKKGKNIGPNSWWKSEEATKRVLEEIKRIAEYTLKGDLSIN
ncbi:MAG: YdcF family protein [Bacilli bacterium]|nr:YdcF family protein [Bacilli bacterium]